jgi:integrase
VGSIEPYKTAKGKRYRVRYRDADRRSRERAGFARKIEAEEYLASVTVQQLRGEFVDPNAGRAELRELGLDWLASKASLKPSSYRPLEIAWRLHVEPYWGRRRLGEVRHSDVQRWLSQLARNPDGSARSATTVTRAFGVLAGILDVAVLDRRIPANPARGVALPRKSRKPRNYLDDRQVELLARSAGERATLVRVLAYTGLRWGEVSGLRVRNYDSARRRLAVEENAVTVGGQIVVGTPKSHQARWVPVPSFLCTEIDSLSAGRGRDELLFGKGNAYLRRPDQRGGWFVGAVRRSQAIDETFPRVTPHDLRHTAASLAIAAGANVKAVQRMLGHASAAMTLDVYADLFDEDLELVSARLDARRSRALSSDTGLDPPSSKSLRYDPRSN